MTLSIYKADLITSGSYEKLRVCHGVYLLEEDGIILDVFETLPETYEGLPVRELEGILIPAFSDLHIHAPQYTERGIGMDCLLFEWLNTYTVPEDSKFKDLSYAKVIYPQLIRDLLRNGTFQANFFTTIHYDACDLFWKMLEESGMYAYAGKINMDRNSPDYYVEDTKTSLEETERFLKEHPSSSRVKALVIPRFAPTCGSELMEGLGKLVRKYDAGLPTHLVESKAEAAWSKELYPDCASDGEIYERYGLLDSKGPKIFAHVIFPTETEERILKRYDCLSVHCPDATTNITAGIMPASCMHEKGLKIALGSDIGGGHFPGIYRQVSRAVQLSKMKEFYEEGYKRLSFANAFYMATAEGGRAFGNFGKLEKGYHFNALLIDDMSDTGRKLSPEEALERFCYIGDDRNIKERWIDGKQIDPETIYEQLTQL